MSNTTEALAALHAAEAELEAALAAEKGVEPENGTAADEPLSAPVAVAEAPPTVLGPEQIRVAKEFLSREPGASFHIPDTPFSRGDDVPPSPIDFEPLKPKWLVLPGYLGPIAINGS